MFIIIPVIFALLGLGASFVMPKEAKYEGTATVFTGAIKLKALTHPTNIVAKFGEGIEGEVDAFVSSDSFIKVKIFSDHADSMERDLAKITAGIEEELLASYDQRYKVTEEYIVSLEDDVKKLKDVLSIYSAKAESGNLPLEQDMEIASIVEMTEKEISEKQTAIQRVKGDLTFFEKPSIVSQSIEKTETYLMELTIAGFALGLMMTFLILILWKYIIDARRYYGHD